MTPGQPDANAADQFFLHFLALVWLETDAGSALKRFQLLLNRLSLPLACGSNAKVDQVFQGELETL